MVGMVTMASKIDPVRISQSDAYSSKIEGSEDFGSKSRMPLIAIDTES